MKFDYLIIGAGSAGCVLANRLSENRQNNVAIFEAGKPSDSWKVNMPLAILYTMHDPKYNYKYYSEPEPHLHNRNLFCPRGKMIGGCSAHNGMVYVRGNPNDYQRWASFGLKDWSYEKVYLTLKKLKLGQKVKMNIVAEMEFYQLINLKTKILYLKLSSIQLGKLDIKSTMI